MQPVPVPANPAEAMSMLNAAFDHLSAADWAAMGPHVQGEVLCGLRGAQARLTAAQAAVLAAFTASQAYEPDHSRGLTSAR